MGRYPTPFNLGRCRDWQEEMEEGKRGKRGREKIASVVFLHVGKNVSARRHLA